MRESTKIKPGDRFVITLQKTTVMVSNQYFIVFPHLILQVQLNFFLLGILVQYSDHNSWLHSSKLIVVVF